MAQIEIKKSSIDEKEAVKKETVKEISNLKKEVEKGPITKKDVEAFIREAKEGMAETMGRAALEAAEYWKVTKEWLLINDKELQILNLIFEKMIVSVRNNPRAYLERQEDGKVYMTRDSVVKFANSLSEEELAVMKKYEIE